jgi:hypothetical protein
MAVYEFVGLSTREGFNRSLRHFQAVNEILPDFEGRTNLADILNALLDAKRLESQQVAPILNALLVGHKKYAYVSRSRNLAANVENFGAIVAEVSKWKAVDLVLAYYHPDLGLMLINPKNRAHWESVQSLRKNELVTIYCGTLTDKAPDKLLGAAIDALVSLLEGGRVKAPAGLAQGKFRFKAVKVAAAPAPRVAPRAAPRAARAPAAPKGRGKAAASAPAAPASPVAPAAPAAAPAAPPTGGQKRRMTPMYSIPVTNELFHNGNVEAWKKIIASYNGKYPGLEVFIFYEGERIHDINTLFKWGKVKHGGQIMIAIAGDEIKDVAKLQRYLRQGASPAFEAFLRFPVNTVLNLF